MTETILYHCHFWNRHTQAAWNKLIRESNRPCYCLFDTKNEKAPDVERLIPISTSGAGWIGFRVHPLGYWHNAELAIMQVLDRIEGSHFWRLDHDIRFTGNWAEFFDSYANNQSDLLTPLIRKYDSTDEWPWWTIDHGSYTQPGSVASLMCLYRISRPAVELLMDRYRHGWFGFSETVVPTIIKESPLEMCEMVNDKYFDLRHFKPGPIRSRTSTCNKLEHPIRETDINGLEVDTCRDALAKYCTGTGLDLGFGGSPIVDTAICIDRAEGSDSRASIPSPTPTHIIGDISDLSWFANNSLDYVFSSHALEDFQDTAKVLTEWMRVLKPGGNLVLFLPDQPTYVAYCQSRNQLPNQDHKHAEFSLGYVKARIPGIYEVVYEAWPFPGNAYSFALVVKKV